MYVCYNIYYVCNKIVSREIRGQFDIGLLSCIHDDDGVPEAKPAQAVSHDRLDVDSVNRSLSSSHGLPQIVFRPVTILWSFWV